MRFKDKRAVITGASTGIGRAISCTLANDGAYVVLVARSVQGLEQTLTQIEKSGGRGEVYQLDLRKSEEITQFGQHAKKSLGSVDILVNVAGVWHSSDKAYADIALAEYPIEIIRETYDVGITAPTFMVHQLVPLMTAGSKIINISGTFENGAKGWLPYYVSKKSIEDLTVGLSEELRDKHIQVNCVSPSDVATDSYKKFFPEYATPDKALAPEDVADLVAYLASPAADHITGQIIVIKKKVK